MKKILLIIFSYLMVLNIAGTGHVAKATTSIPETIVATDTYQNGYKYDPPVTVTTFRFYAPFAKFIAGEDINNNVWTRAYEDYCGIKLRSIFSLTDFITFDTKVNACIATNSLPDLMPVYEPLYTRLADADKLADLTQTFNQYADPEIKAYFENQNGGLTKKTVTKDNKLLALASVTQDQPNLLWIRNDWLKKYHLSWPKNIQQTINVMKTFASKNPTKKKTYALPMDHTLSTIQGLANAYGAYSSIWTKNEDGLSFSDISTKWKAPLNQLRSLYKSGYIDKEFAYSYNINSSTNYGVLFEDANAPYDMLLKSVTRDPKAEWKCAPIKNTSGNYAKCQISNYGSFYNCVNKNSIYPEALVLLTNIWDDLMNSKDPEDLKYHHFVKNGTRYNSFYYPIVNGLESSLQKSITMQEHVSKALKTGDKSKLNNIQKSVYDEAYLWYKKKNPKGWAAFATYGIGGSYSVTKQVLDKKAIYLDRDWEISSNTWNNYGPALTGNKTVYFAKIISGRGYKSTDAGFSAWSKYFNSNGGKKVTTEMNNWWKSGGKEAFDSRKK